MRSESGGGSAHGRGGCVYGRSEAVARGYIARWSQTAACDSSGYLLGRRLRMLGGVGGRIVGVVEGELVWLWPDDAFGHFARARESGARLPTLCLQPLTREIAPCTRSQVCVHLCRSLHTARYECDVCTAVPWLRYHQNHIEPPPEMSHLQLLSSANVEHRTVIYRLFSTGCSSYVHICSSEI